MKTQADWDFIFSNAINTSYPHSSVLISKVNPCQTGLGSPRSIYKDDQKMIHASADKYGFTVYQNTNNLIGFQNVKLRAK